MELYQIYNRYPSQDWDFAELICNHNSDIRLLKLLIEKINHAWQLVKPLKTFRFLDFIDDHKLSTADVVFYKFCYFYFDRMSQVDNPLSFFKRKLTQLLNYSLKNEHINMGLIIKYKDLPWDWPLVCQKVKMNICNMIALYPDIPLNYYDYCKNPGLTVEILKRLHKYKVNLNWNTITLNDAITPDEMFLNTDLPWNYDLIIRKPNLSIQNIVKCKNYKNQLNHLLITDIDFIIENKQSQLNWNLLSSVVHIDDIMRHSELPWNYVFVSENPTLTIKIVKNRLHLKWNWPAISKNDNITKIDIQKNENLPFDWQNVAQNKNIDIKFVCKYINHFYNSDCWINLSQNVAFTLDDVYQYVIVRKNDINDIVYTPPGTKACLSYTMVKNDNITYWYIHDYLNNYDFVSYNSYVFENENDINSFCKYLPWSFTYAQRTMMMTTQFDNQKINLINFYNLSQNDYTCKTVDYYENRRENSIKFCKQIKEELLHITWHPDHFKKLCLTESERKIFDNKNENVYL